MRVLSIIAKEQLRLTEAPVPEPGPGQVRIRVAYVGICGSDLHYYFDGGIEGAPVREPLTPGHELSATVDLDPSGTWTAGTPVTVHPATLGTPIPALADKPHLWPNGAYLGSARTMPHTQGAAADYMLVRESMLRRVPEGLSLQAAALAEPLSVGLHALVVSGGVAGARVLVVGAGPIGLVTAVAAKAAGSATVAVSDRLNGPLERAQTLGVDAVYGSDDELPEEGFDVAVECAGVAAATNAAIIAVRRGGIVTQVGISSGLNAVDLGRIVSKELQLRGSFRFNDEIGDALALLRARPEIAGVVTHVVSLEDAESAFAVARSAQESGKVLLDLQGS